MSFGLTPDRIKLKASRVRLELWQTCEIVYALTLLKVLNRIQKSRWMKYKSIDRLPCIACGSTLRCESVASDPPNGTDIQGRLTCTSCGRVYPIVRSIPRFVPSEGYAHSFGYQWNRFDKMQLESYMGNDLSHERFLATTQWPHKMEGQVILEAGCGMGASPRLHWRPGPRFFLLT
jgi:uncharacterized protein YbaR (Trm112 family)